MAGDYTRQIPRRGFALAMAATILMMAAASAPSLFYPQIAEQLGLVPVATTLVFAVYTFTLLAALLYLGPLSDHIGRRPVVTAGSLALALSLAMFWFADSLATLLVARALQGLAAGLLIPALSAMMIDFEPPSHPNIAALWNTIGPMIGLGTGALGAALLLDLTPEPTAAVFGPLVLAFLTVAATVWSTPELVPKTRIRRGDLRPRFMVPLHLRRMFTAGVPAIIAGWATNGLFLALGAGLVGSELGGSTHTHAGIVIFALAISGITASSVHQPVCDQRPGIRHRSEHRRPRTRFLPGLRRVGRDRRFRVRHSVPRGAAHTHAPHGIVGTRRRDGCDLHGRLPGIRRAHHRRRVARAGTHPVRNDDSPRCDHHRPQPCSHRPTPAHSLAGRRSGRD